MASTNRPSTAPEANDAQSTRRPGSGMLSVTGTSAIDDDIMIMRTRTDNLALAAAFLAAGGARFVVVGGCALRLHGYARLAPDLDVVPEPSPGNLRRLFTALGELGTVGRALRPSDRALANGDIVTHTSPIGSVDVLLERGRAEHATLERRAISVSVQRQAVRVAALDDVLRLRARFGKDPIDA